MYQKFEIMVVEQCQNSQIFVYVNKAYIIKNDQIS